MSSMPTKIPDSIINNVRQSTDIVHIIGEYVQLKKQGKNYVGLCPFHEEKTPSFSVNEEKQLFHCFGCGKGGNVFTFISSLENLTFIEAVRLLAERANITLPATQVSSYTNADNEDDEQLLNSFDWLTKYYHHLLKYAEDGREGNDYFANRHLTKETIDIFQLGFAPYNAELTVQFLKEKGFHEQTLVKHGILNRHDDGGLTDPFRGRIIFPIRNHLGKTIAFGGRATRDIKPKYLNSPENKLFHKGSILYNFDLARRDIRKTNDVILFEGYMDVISAYQAGITNCVATLGTALTQFQARLLARYVDRVIICYDGDEAGINATFEAAKLLEQGRCQVKIAQLNEGQDPDSYINEHGGESFRQEVIEKSVSYTEFYMTYKKAHYNLSVQSERVAYLDDVIKQIARLQSPIEREYYVQQLSAGFDISLDTLLSEISRYIQGTQSVRKKDKSQENRYTNDKVNHYTQTHLLPAFHNAERFLIAHMLVNGHVLQKVQDELGIQFNIDEHNVIVTHLYALYEEYDEINISLLIDRLDDEKERAIVSQLANMSINEDVSDQEINDYIKSVNAKRTTGNELDDLNAQLQEAIANGDDEEALHITQRIIAMQKQLKR